MTAPRGTFEARLRFYRLPQIEAARRCEAIWSQAGAISSRSPALQRGASGPAWRGLPDARAAALDEARALSRTLGILGEQRLREYLLEGLSLGELAARYHYRPDEMAAILKADLDAAAHHFHSRCRVTA